MTCCWTSATSHDLVTRGSFSTMSTSLLRPVLPTASPPPPARRGPYNMPLKASSSGQTLPLTCSRLAVTPNCPVRRPARAQGCSEASLWLSVEHAHFLLVPWVGYGSSRVVRATHVSESIDVRGSDRANGCAKHGDGWHITSPGQAPDECHQSVAALGLHLSVSGGGRSLAEPCSQHARGRQNCPARPGRCGCKPEGLGEGSLQQLAMF